MPLNLTRCKCTVIPYRYVTAFLLGTATIVYFLMFVSFMRAFRHLHPKHPYYNSSYSINCRFDRNVSRIEHVNENFYHWPSTRTRELSRAYVWGYLITPLLSGLVSDRKGGKYFVSIPILVISVIEVIAPSMLSGSDSDFYILFTWYFLIGAGAAMVACGINSILAHWTPVEERGRLGSLAYCGTQFAVTFHSEIPDNFILATNLWNTPFYIYSALGLIWSVSFLFLGSSHYHIRKHGMHQSELQYLQDKLRKILNLNGFDVSFQNT